jgi:hypothetical protein
MKKRPSGCVVALLAFGVLAAVVVWRLRTPPRFEGAVPTAQLPAEQQEQRRENAQALENQIGDIAASARRREAKSFELKATAEQLTSLLEEHTGDPRSPIHDVRVGIQPGELAVQGIVPYRGLDVTITLKGNVVLRDNKLVYEADSLYLGGAPAPAEYKAKAEQGITEKLNELYAKAPVRLDQVKLEPNLLVIDGVTQ